MAAISVDVTGFAPPTAAFHTLELAAVDGTPLAARHFAPAGPACGAALIAAAIGVPQTFYEPLATWLAAIGLHALTFDYRGIGLSRRGPLRQLDIDLTGWARLDATAALRALQDRAPGAPLTWIGHSLGAQIIPFVPDHRELAKIVTIAAGSGYWRENAPPIRRRAWLLWHAITPPLTAVFGYFPGKPLRMVGDLPAGSSASGAAGASTRVRRRRRGPCRARAVRARHHADHFAVIHRRRDDVGSQHRVAARLLHRRAARPAPVRPGRPRRGADRPLRRLPPRGARAAVERVLRPELAVA